MAPASGDWLRGHNCQKAEMECGRSPLTPLQAPSPAGGAGPVTSRCSELMVVPPGLWPEFGLAWGRLRRRSEKQPPIGPTLAVAHLACLCALSYDAGLNGLPKVIRARYRCAGLRLHGVGLGLLEGRLVSLAQVHIVTVAGTAAFANPWRQATSGHADAHTGGAGDAPAGLLVPPLNPSVCNEKRRQQAPLPCCTPGSPRPWSWAPVWKTRRGRNRSAPRPGCSTRRATVCCCSCGLPYEGPVWSRRWRINPALPVGSGLPPPQSRSPGR